MRWTQLLLRMDPGNNNKGTRWTQLLLRMYPGNIKGTRWTQLLLLMDPGNTKKNASNKIPALSGNGLK